MALPALPLEPCARMFLACRTLGGGKQRVLLVCSSPQAMSAATLHMRTNYPKKGKSDWYGVLLDDLRDVVLTAYTLSEGEIRMMLASYLPLTVSCDADPFMDALEKAPEEHLLAFARAVDALRRAPYVAVPDARQTLGNACEKIMRTPVLA